MDGIYFVVAMAGRGKRFADAGFTQPKYMIKAGVRTLFERAVFSLPLKLSAKILFIALREHEERFGLRAFIGSKLPSSSWELVLLDEPTRGQAETVMAAVNMIPPAAALAVYNIDTAFSSSSLEARLSDPAARRDGVIGAFKLKGADDKWSFARTDGSGSVLETAEKVRISDNALTGFYHFSKASDFFEAAGSAVRGRETVRGEFYIAPLYNRLIASGRRFVLDLAEQLTPLGTPEDVASFGTRLSGRKEE